MRATRAGRPPPHRSPPPRRPSAGRGEHRSGGGRPLAAEVRDPRHRGPRRDAADRQGPLLHRHDLRAARSCSTRSPRPRRRSIPRKIPGGEDEPANIFCAGQSFLDDGTVIVMGGTVGSPGGPQDDLHLRPDHGDLAPAREHASRSLVPDPGAARGRAHRGDGRARRAGGAERQPADRELHAELRLRHAPERPRADRPAARRRPLSAPLPDAERPRARCGARAERQLVLQPQPDRSAVLGGRSQSHPPHLGHRGPDSEWQHGGLDARRADRRSRPRLAAGHGHLHPAAGGARPSTRPTRGRDGRPRLRSTSLVRTTTPSCCRTARWQRSAAATGS